MLYPVFWSSDKDNLIWITHCFAWINFRKIIVTCINIFSMLYIDWSNLMDTGHVQSFGFCTWPVFFYFPMWKKCVRYWFTEIPYIRVCRNKLINYLRRGHFVRYAILERMKRLLQNLPVWKQISRLDYKYTWVQNNDPVQHSVPHRTTCHWTQWVWLCKIIKSRTNEVK